MKWIHLENPSLEKMQQIAKEHRFPLDYLLSTLDPDEVSRSENLDCVKPALMSLLFPIENDKNQDKGSYVTRTLSIILTDSVLFTCVKQTPDFLQEIIVRDYIIIKDDSNTLSIVIEIIWQMTKQYVYAGRDVTAHMDELYGKSRQSSKSELLYHLADLDRSIIYLSTAIEENHLILKKLNEQDYMKPFEEEMHDILVENHQADRMINQTRQILAQLDTTFSSIIQNNLNEIMKILTSLTIIITIPSIIGSIWGMNVNLPLMSHPLAFLIILIIIVLLMIVSVFWLRRKDLL